MTLIMAVNKAVNLANTTHETAIVLKHPEHDYYLAGLLNQVSSNEIKNRIIKTIEPQ